MNTTVLLTPPRLQTGGCWSAAVGGPALVNTIVASAEIYSPGAPAPEDATPPHCLKRRTARGSQTAMSRLHEPQK